MLPELPADTWWLVVAAALASLLMIVVWVIHLPMKNAAIVDAAWALGIGLCGILYAWQLDGWELRRLLLAAMTGFWGFRLSSHLLFNRILGHPEEGRYQELRRRWGGNMALKFFWFYQLQALTVVLLSLPFFLIARNEAAELHPLEILGGALFLLAKLGEWLADHQLNQFRLDPANKGRTCRAGLWRYSRHPNYFFEWTIWVAWACIALPASAGWMGLLSPALILYFLLFVTGIPPTEEQSVRSRGDDYRRYQATTSAFFPWFPKEQS
jgi:steroid 5-alpha reductase family enzyme